MIDDASLNYENGLGGKSEFRRFRKVGLKNIHWILVMSEEQQLGGTGDSTFGDRHMVMKLYPPGTNF